MNSSKSKTDIICEKYVREGNLDPSIKNDTSICSCSNCDSFECFALRKKGQCVCQGRKCQPLPESNNMPNFCQSKSSVKTSKLEADSIHRERVKKEITYEYNISNNVASVKRPSHYSYNCVPESNRNHTDDIRIRISTERLTHSDTITYSRQNYDTNTAKLSAQIMNVPYNEFKESISYNKTEYSLPKTTKLTKFDIFRRIKEAYKACSCKVCECLIGKTPNYSEYCKCKPCECNECTDFMKGIDYKDKIKQMHIGCPCIRCDRQDDCKGITKKGPLPYCDCDPCDCLKCSDSFNKPCNCQPCECIVCKSYSATKPRINNTLVVASMREDVPRAYCQCSPCDCAECGQDFSMASSLRREMGTGMNRPVMCSCEICMSQSCEARDSNSCTCDVQKRLMRKPVEKDTRDYDIHRASVKKNDIERACRNKNDTIAMFAAVGNSFPKFDIKNNSCSCGDCECIVCCCKENTAIPVKQKLSKYRNFGMCKCSPCECVICDSSNKCIDFSNRKNVCSCNTCDCLKCDGLSQPSTSNNERHINSIRFKTMTSSNTCKCGPCECTDCQKMMYKCIGDSCYCTHCKCQMCTDQAKFINETVYRNKNDSSDYSNNINDNFFLNKNDGKTCLTPKTLQSDKECMIQIKSRQHLPICNKSSSVKGFKDNPIRKSTQVLIANNSEIREHKRLQTAGACEGFVQCKEKKIIQSYHRASEYESSRSFMSEKSSLGLAYRISNIQPNGNLNSVLEQNYQTKPVFKIEKPGDRLVEDNTLIKFPVKTCLDDFTTFKTSSYIKTNKSNEKSNDPMGSLTTTAQKKNRDNYPNSIVNKHDQNEYSFPEDNESLCSIKSIGEACLELRKNSELTIQDHEITNIQDLSLNLVSSLKNANQRLSILMKPRFSYYHSKLRPSKADISLPKNISDTKETTGTKNQEISAPLKNCYPKYTQDLSDIEIDYNKLKSTLQQANAFSEELTKLLKEYKKANMIIENSSLQESLPNVYSNKLLNMNHCRKMNNIEPNTSIYGNIKCENLAEGLDFKPYSLAYEPVKKYGSHNLNVLTIKQEISETDFHQIANIDNNIKSLPDNENVKVTLNVDDDINKCTSFITKENIERHVSSKLGPHNILIKEPSSSVDNKIEDEFNIPIEPTSNSNKKNEDLHKSRSDKNQKIKGGKRLRFPRSVILNKRLKLKEALINLANAANTGIGQKNLVPQSIQCDTQHQNKCIEDKRETASTSTDAAGGYDTSRFVPLSQDVHELENPSWSILKKNCLMNSPYLQYRGISLIPPLLLEVKDTLRAISMQHGVAGRSETRNEVTVTGHGNKALLQLQTEVNTLWESSMPQPLHESESKPGSLIGKSKLDLGSKDFKIASSQTCNMTNNVEKAVDCMDSTFSVAVLQRQIQELLNITSVKDPDVKKPLKVIDVGNSDGTSGKFQQIIGKISCDILKVKFLDLRRVSDHTVLIKWKTPEDITSVQGYELLVDGRAVQKILSPTRSMAVVTCLPHIEKVLITVRTLVSAALQRTHYPSATIIYRTRAK